MRGRSDMFMTASTYFGSVEEEVDSGRRCEAVDVDVSVDGGITGSPRERSRSART